MLTHVLLLSSLVFRTSSQQQLLNERGGEEDATVTVRAVMRVDEKKE
jgi:hypothetical protein